MLKDWPEDRTLYFCDERGGEPLVSAIGAGEAKAAILIGPEGGFTDAENAAIASLRQSIRTTLGSNILRADTAAGTAVAAPPSVRVRDIAGSPVSGVNVTFTLTAGAGSTTPASPATVATNATVILVNETDWLYRQTDCPRLAAPCG